jgi:hypothetical protein
VGEDLTAGRTQESSKNQAEVSDLCVVAAR